MTIKKKIFWAVSILGTITLLNILILFYYINNFKMSLEENTAVRRPSLLAISELNSLVNNSKNLSFIWRKLDVDSPDKVALVDIHKNRYPKNKELLLKLSQQWNSKNDIDTLKKVFDKMNGVMIDQNNLMTSLNNFEAYRDIETDPLRSMEIEDLIFNINKKSSEVEILTKKLLEHQKQENLVNEQSLKDSMNILIAVLSISGLILLLSVLGLAYMLFQQITIPIVKIKDTIVQLSKGELMRSTLEKSETEIGQMAAAVDLLVEGLEKTSNFAENIGNGNYDSDFKPLSEKDILGNSLLEMRKNLKDVAIKEQQRKWVTEGVAKFAELLRDNSNIDNLAVEIIRNLVKYLNANQGGLFIKEHDHHNQAYLELKGCYAYDRNKFLQKRIEEGEGLIGQSWIEKDKIFLTDVPESYLKITSGLGLAKPRCVLIVPLIYNEEVNGVIELASFNVFQDFEIEFIEKVAQSTASTLSSVMVNQRTSKLLQESRELAEQLRSQEEELRQNQEEMQATAEETERRLNEAQKTIKKLEEENSSFKNQKI